MRKKPVNQFGKRVADALEAKGGSLQDLSRAIGCSYEMARRYSHGIAIPHDPEKLQALAAYLGKSVGWLLAEETNVAKGSARAATPANRITTPVTADTLVLLEDDAMLSHAQGLRLLGSGDQVILGAHWPKPGNVVAVRDQDRTTLRRLFEENGTVYFRPARDGFPTYTGMVAVMGVVIEARAMIQAQH